MLYLQFDMREFYYRKHGAWRGFAPTQNPKTTLATGKGNVENVVLPPEDVPKDKTIN